MPQTTISGHYDARYHAKTVIRSFLFAAAGALAAAFTFAAPAQADANGARVAAPSGRPHTHRSRGTTAVVSPIGGTGSR